MSLSSIWGSPLLRLQLELDRDKLDRLQNAVGFDFLI
jgi:hypothetical protein